MKAAQISRYSKQIDVDVNEISVPSIKANEVLVKVKAAAVNPLEMLIMSGSIRLIQDYKFQTPEMKFQESWTKWVQLFLSLKRRFSLWAFTSPRLADLLTMLPLMRKHRHMPQNLDFDQAAAAPLTGLTAYQAFHEELRTIR